MGGSSIVPLSAPLTSHPSPAVCPPHSIPVQGADGLPEQGQDHGCHAAGPDH